MSIIYDALKKTEATNNEQPKPVNRPKKNYFLEIIIFVLVLLAGAAMANFFFSAINKTQKAKTTPSIHATTSIAAKQTTPVRTTVSAPAPATQPTPQAPSTTKAPVPPVINESRSTDEAKMLPTLTLNGLVCSEEDSWVMINNRILKKGDSVEEAVVESISPTEVVLDFEGQKINLQVK